MKSNLEENDMVEITVSADGFEETRKGTAGQWGLDGFSIQYIRFMPGEAKQYSDVVCNFVDECEDAYAGDYGSYSDFASEYELSIKAILPDGTVVQEHVPNVVDRLLSTLTGESSKAFELPFKLEWRDEEWIGFGNLTFVGIVKSKLVDGSDYEFTGPSSLPSILDSLKSIPAIEINTEKLRELISLDLKDETTIMIGENSFATKMIKCIVETLNAFSIRKGFITRGGQEAAHLLEAEDICILFMPFKPESPSRNKVEVNLHYCTFCKYSQPESFAVCPLCNTKTG